MGALRVSFLLTSPLKLLAMREVLGAGRGVQAGEVEIPAMAAEAGRATRQGAERDEESDGCDGAQDCERVRVCIRNTT